MKENLRFEVINVDKNNYPEFKNQLVQLFLNAFTKGENTQYITLPEAEKYILELQEKTFGKLAIHSSTLIGALLAYPLSFESDFLSFNSNIRTENAVYIAEVMVNEKYRGKRVATALIENFLKTFSSKYSDAVIRVWDKNISALSLYKRLGFEDTGIRFSQTKKRSETETFEMNKIYLHKKLK